MGREGGDLLDGHKEKERREGQVSREETSGGREGRAGRLFLKVRQSIPTPPQPQARHNEHTHIHTHTHKQTDTPSLPTTHRSYLSGRLPGVGGDRGGGGGSRSGGGGGGQLLHRLHAVEGVLDVHGGVQGGDGPLGGDRGLVLSGLRVCCVYVCMCVDVHM